MPFNLPGVYLGLYALLFRPALLRPTLVYEEFSDIPWHELDRRIRDVEARQRGRRGTETKHVDIRHVCLDKDNCLAANKAMDVYPPYRQALTEMLASFGRENCLIVSNSSGTLMASEDPDGAAARRLATTIHLPVLLHKKPKPACGDDVLAYFGGAAADRKRVAAMPDREKAETRKADSVVDLNLAPESIVVVGDRLSTDVLMANLNGMRSIWLRRGVSERGNGLGGAVERIWASVFLR